MDNEIWCVWALLPNRKGPDGFSMTLTGMTRAEAERAVECSTFKAKAMRAGQSASYRPAALEPAPVGTRGELTEDTDLIAEYKKQFGSVTVQSASIPIDPFRSLPADSPSGIVRRPAKSIRLDP